jgi:hypothetical protein
VSYDEAKNSTTLTWSGDTSTGDGNRIRLAAILRDGDGSPVAGAPVTMTFDGASTTLSTDANGEAAQTVKVTGKPHTHHAQAVYAEDASHYGSSVDQDLADQR